NFAQPFAVAIEERVHYRGAARVGKNFAAQADEPAAGNAEFNAHSAIAVVVHLDHLALARAQLFDDHANKIFRDINGEHLHRLHEFSVNALGDDLRLADHKLEALAPHGLDENGELKLAASHNLERVRVSGFFHAQRNVGEQLLLQ